MSTKRDRIVRAVENAWYAAQESSGEEIPPIGEIWLWLPVLSAERIIEILDFCGKPWKPGVKKEKSCEG